MSRTIHQRHGVGGCFSPGLGGDPLGDHPPPHQKHAQLQGTAMGAACAPSYANLFLGLWERDLFASDHCMSMERVVFWAHFIDDIFLIWHGTPLELQSFVRELNHNDLNIHLTYKFHFSRIDFLDVMVERGADGLLTTSVFCKETDVNAVLHASSSHPPHVIGAVPTGQFLRLKRICSSEETFEIQADDLKNRFLDRGYSKRSVKRAYNRAKHFDRHQLLFSSKQTKATNQVRLVTQYHSRWRDMSDILAKHWPILLADPVLKQYLPSHPFVTARRSKNLGDHLVRSYLPPTNPRPIFSNGSRTDRPRWGCKPCACPNIEYATHFHSSDGREFSITHTINCLTTMVVYHGTCPCNKIYIGLTTRTLKNRAREHVRDILAAAKEDNVDSLKTIPRHFKLHHSCDPSGFRIKGIDRLLVDLRGGNLSHLLAQKESRWIRKLQTMQPHGLNETLSFAPFL
ncbi:unnamed protein product [Ranitomeya imitator]|uniref:Helix-turn-helix domain-containing protein n=1 Tax=Ranitomeya imitator TaxID=111125 RepID=A0ABN9LMT2_9NEOB|nr:unnamed protein product [Ranitomeya imitator]